MNWTFQQRYSKKLFLTGTLILMLFCFSRNGRSQNLQFSRVIYLSTNDTVDAGKVWKVERILNTNPNSAVPVYINGSNVGFIYQGAWGLSVNNGGVQSSFTGPIWLPAGTVLNNNPELRFSIIEFNVVP